MSDPQIAEAKEKLPLPTLLHRLGLGAHAKKSGRCPFHDDQHASFSIFKNGKGLWSWRCHAENIGGDEISFLEHYENVSNGGAIGRFLELAGVNGSKPLGHGFKKARATMKGEATTTPKEFNWPSCVEALEKHAEQIASARGFSLEFVREIEGERPDRDLQRSRRVSRSQRRSRCRLSLPIRR